MSLKALNALYRKPKSEFIEIKDLVHRNDLGEGPLKPPEDRILSYLVAQLFKGVIQCTVTNVPLAIIRPFDTNYFRDYPEPIIQLAITHLRHAAENRLLVYWDGNSFVMSDDYCSYLAFQRLKYRKVPVAILGEYPKHIAGTTQIGGKELLPPVWALSSSAFSTTKWDVENENLKGGSDSKDISSDVAYLYGICLAFCGLLSDPTRKERELHDFILNYPILLDPRIRDLKSEVSLGKEFRVDLIAKYDPGDKRILIVELEPANVSVFTASGQPQARVTHAYQQVEDWLRWWNEHPTEVPQGLDSTLKPRGLVVLGRSNSWDDKTRKRLSNLNSNRDVKLKTYDDLLNDLENLIFNLENMTQPRIKKGKGE